MAVYPKAEYAAKLERLKSKFIELGVADISQLQNTSRRASAAPSPPYVSKVHVRRPPEDDVVRVLLLAIEGLRQSPVQYTRPSVADIDAEWVAEGDVADDAPTIIYLHAGGFIYGSPGMARRTTRELARHSGGRCFAVAYRYATEQPFPASLLDVFVAYLSLLAPPKESNGIMTPAKRIVLAGESAGLNLALSLIQILLYLRNESASLRFHGRDIEIELPAGIAGMCGFLDLTGSLPSRSKNAQWDYLEEHEPMYEPGWKDQELWPADPPRADVYCEKSAMLHPLVSPVTAISWKGCPPIFLAVGDERGLDSNFVVAQTAAREGVTVHLQRYEYMAHVWPTVFRKLPHSAHVLYTWAEQCRDMVQGHAIPNVMETIAFDTLKSTKSDIMKCTSLSRKEVLGYMQKASEARLVVSRSIPEPKL